MNRRVVVTGIGVVSPIGIGKEEFTEHLFNGYNAADRIRKFDPTHYRTQIACEIKEFDPMKYGINAKEAREMDLFSQYAVAASAMAIKDAHYPLRDRNDDVAIIIGSGIGGIGTLEREHSKLMADGLKGPIKIWPRLAKNIMPNAPAGYVSRMYGITGRSKAVSTACATGADAIIDGVEEIELDHYLAVIAGSSEAPITPISIGTFGNMKAMPHSFNDKPRCASRPFDKKREGFVMGEGAGVVILEYLEHALERNANIYAEIAGYWCTSDAYDMVAPHPEGSRAKDAMKGALDMAGLKPSDVDYVNTHATSTPAGDEIEVKAIRDLFGEHAEKLVLSSTKSMMGHLLGAAGSVEFIACVLALEHQMVPPTINLEEPLDSVLNFVSHTAQNLEVKVIMDNNFGFGGHNSCIVLKKFDY